VSTIHSQSVPRDIERGVDQTLTLDLFAADGVTPVTIEEGGKITIFRGSIAVVDAVPVTSAGPPATYNLLAATTTDLELADNWLELWDVTVAGKVERFRRRAYLVRHPLHPVVVLQDLEDRHKGVLTLFPDLAAKLRTAYGIVQRRLIALRNRPQLVFDSWALFEVILNKALELAFNDARTDVNDGTWRDFRNDYRQDYEAAWDAVDFAYDWDSDGTIQDDDEYKPAGLAVVYFNKPPLGIGGR